MYPGPSRSRHQDALKHAKMLLDISEEWNCNFSLRLNISLFDMRIEFSRHCEMEIVTWGNIMTIILLLHKQEKCSLITVALYHIQTSSSLRIYKGKCKLPKCFQTNGICMFFTWLICVNHSYFLNLSSIFLSPVLCTHGDKYRKPLWLIEVVQELFIYVSLSSRAWPGPLWKWSKG